jgi:hypothetical protein
VNLPGIAGIGVNENELADVVQKRGDHQAVTKLVIDLSGQAVGRALGRDRVQAEALRNPLPYGCPLEEVERPGSAGDRVHRGGREDLHALDRALDTTPAAAVDLVGQPEHRHGQCDIGLDRGNDVGGGRIAGFEQAQHAIARLDQHRKCLQRFERRGQAPPVTLVVVSLARRVRIGW